LVDLGLPYEPEVKQLVDAQQDVFEAIGCAVEREEPDLTGADEVFRGLRAWLFEAIHGADYRAGRELKQTVGWNVEQGMRLAGPDLPRLDTIRTQLYERMRLFMTRFDFLVLPVTQVLPFDVRTVYPTEVAGVEMETYIDWMRSCYLISAIGNPAISVPCGFTHDRLPVGPQIVGPYNCNWRCSNLHSPMSKPPSGGGAVHRSAIDGVVRPSTWNRRARPAQETAPPLYSGDSRQIRANDLVTP
jgi:amidase